jgi:hypothetical protein
MASIVTPLELTATAELSQSTNVFFVAESLTTPATGYLTLPVLGALSNVLATMPVGNVPVAYQYYLAQLTANNCPALMDAVPGSFLPVLGAVFGNNWNPLEGFVGGMVLDLADREVGNGDAAIFGQIFSAATGYVTTTNQFINSSLNSQTYMGTTFTSMNSLTTGNLTDINAATNAFSEDLAKLGNLINLDNLDNFGSPLALIQQLSSLAGIIPSVSNALIQVGIDVNVVATFSNATTEVIDSINKKIYQAMTTITGTNLSDVLQIFEVTTANITTMADLLNPAKIFPNSYQSLTVKTATGLRGIYTSSGAVNTNLEQYLPSYVLSVAG